MRKMIVAAVAAALTLALAAPAMAGKPAWAEAAKPGSQSIVDIVISNPNVVGDEDGDFDVLLQAVLAADSAVLTTLANNDQYTVFAPTDDAFIATLGATDEASAIATVKSLPKGALTDILLYHVIDGRRTSKSVLAAPGYGTLLGERLSKSELVANGVVPANVSASNGIVHILTTGVLLP